MDRDKKRTLALGILIALAILLSVAWFLWGNLINRGTIAVIAEAPFEVEILGSGGFDCPTSPCEITQKIGIKDILITKEGFQAIITSVDVELWSTTDLKLNFELVPGFEKVQESPILEADEVVEYKLVYDSKSGRQKLILADDTREKAIVYFTTQIQKAKIFGHKNNVLILDQDRKIYLVDSRFNQRKIINNQDLKFINEGHWSPDGKYLIFLKKNSDFFWVFDTEKESVEQLDLRKNFTNFTWNSYSQIIFVSSQNFASEGFNGIRFSQDDPALTNSAVEFTFAAYNPADNSYKKLATFTETDKLPEQLMSLNNTGELYFKSGDQDFRLILRKF
ncbi:MAG: hypothetical protein AAB373_06465 [Patescibacteria group bacterium]